MSAPVLIRIITCLLVGLIVYGVARASGVPNWTHGLYAYPVDAWDFGVWTGAATWMLLHKEPRP